MFLLSHCCQPPFPHGGSRSSSPPGGALQHCAGLWTRCGGSSDSNLVLLLCVLASNVHSCRNSCIFFRRHSQCPSTDTVCLVGRVDLVFSLYNWCEGFGSCSLATLPLGFNCGFISTSACGLSTGVCSWGRPGEPGSAPVRARCGGGAVAWVARVLAAQYSGELAARAAGNRVLQKGYGNQD